MSNRKQTKKALFSSVISLILCFSMLIGTTFAWFTDSVQSGLNEIRAGNLDVELYHTNSKTSGEVKGDTKLFTDVTLWEPGAAAYEILTVKNAGTLALKYAMSLTWDKETENDLNGNKLSDILKVAIIEDYESLDMTDREAVVAAAEAAVNGDLKTFADSDVLYPVDNEDGYATEKTACVVVYWVPGETDNNYNANNGQQTSDGKPLHIDLGVSLFATQQMYEEDSFDETYDKDTEVFTVAEANAMLAENKDVTLINCVERDGVIRIPADYTGKLILKNVAIASVQAEGAANIVILGNVTVDASALENTSAITGTELTITGNGNLTAIANGEHAYGIGGDQTAKITIEGIRIADVKGGYVQPDFIKDTSYGTSEVEGGAAIGSGYSGAVITLNDVTIDNAQGGSKAAGIGAKFWTGVTININNSIIKNVQGGNASAGIGGSRVSDDIAPADQYVVINIKGSTVNATGGQFGAGIGSGYDTHCGKNITETICTINIDADSKITAQGGKYAAGVGTGYHVAALAGNIECEVDATSGGSREKYTIAQAVGFGVVDHDREVSYLDPAPSITYQGTVITVPYAQITDADELAEAVAAGQTELYLADGEYDVYGCGGETLTITGSKNAVLVVTGGEQGEAGGQLDYCFDGSTVTFNGVTIKTNNSDYAGYTRLTGVYNNCTFEGNYCLQRASKFTNCTFNTTGNQYNIWTWGASNVEFDGCTFNCDGKSILVYNQSCNLTVNNCVFNDNGTISGKAAIEACNGDNGPNCVTHNIVVNNTTVNGFDVNPNGTNTNSTLWGNKNSLDSDHLKVTVDGDDAVNTITIGTVEELKAFAKDVNVNGNGYSGKTVVLTADIDLGNEAWTPIGQTGGYSAKTYFQGTFNGNGHTISNLNVTVHETGEDGGKNYASGLFGFIDASDAKIVNLNVANATVTGHHWTGVIAGYLTGKITDCTVTNATVTCTHLNGEACGDKAGVIVGYVNSGTVTGNTVKDCTVTAGRDGGQVAGAAKTTQVYDNTAENVIVTAAGDCTGADVKNEEIGRIL